MTTDADVIVMEYGDVTLDFTKDNLEESKDGFIYWGFHEHAGLEVFQLSSLNTVYAEHRDDSHFCSSLHLTYLCCGVEFE